MVRWCGDCIQLDQWESSYVAWSKESSLESSLPDKPLSRSAVEAIDEIDRVRRAVRPTWQNSIHGDGEITEDLIIITDDHVRYLARERGEEWDMMRNEKYADDEEFECVMDNVHDYACEYSEERIERKVREEYGE